MKIVISSLNPNPQVRGFHFEHTRIRIIRASRSWQSVQNTTLGSWGTMIANNGTSIIDQVVAEEAVRGAIKGKTSHDQL